VLWLFVSLGWFSILSRRFFSLSDLSGLHLPPLPPLPLLLGLPFSGVFEVLEPIRLERLLALGGNFHLSFIVLCYLLRC
jgi:hypothetical protein